MERFSTLTVCVCAFMIPVSATGQVGHAPESSPYRDVRAKQILSAAVGYLGGSSGAAGVGPSNGPTYGARFDLHLGGPAEVGFGLELADLERLVVDPTKGAASRSKGTFPQTVVLLEVGLVMRLTGEKSWRGIVPYFGGSTGVVFGASVAQDSSGFEFGTKFHVAPRLGFRWFPSNRITIRVEGRDVLWRLKYPDIFFSAPSEAPEEDPLLDPVTMDETEWTHHPTLTFTIGYAIKL